MFTDQYGFGPGLLPGEVGLLPARVTATYRERFEIVCEAGTGFAQLKTGSYYGGNEVFPTTGDFVLIDQFREDGDSLIVRTLPRRTLFSRLDPSSSGHSAQAVAANFDYVFILQSLNQNFNPHRLERYLTLVWQSGATPVVVLTKADLAEDFSEQLDAARELAMGVGVHPVSTVTEYGLNGLAGYLKPGKTLVFLGSSGVGKSSLLNALAGEELMAVGEIREADGRGRHTTTHRQLIMLASGVMIIDTPGMRELGMWDVTEGLGQSFADVEQYFGLCRFRDCRHMSEPGCAVKAAIERGALSAERWASYLKLKKEARYTEDKAGALRAKQQWHKGIAIQNRTLKTKKR